MFVYSDFLFTFVWFIHSFNMYDVYLEDRKLNLNPLNKLQAETMVKIYTLNYGSTPKLAPYGKDITNDGRTV